MATMQDTYFQKMKPYADKGQAGTGIPSAVILAQWGLETGYGTSVASKKLNNHAGIKANSSGRDYDGGTYAGYNSIDSFVRDYVRVMNLPYYAEVRKAGKTGNISATVKALDNSPWAEDTKYYAKIMDILDNGGKAEIDKIKTTANDIPAFSTDLLGDIKNVIGNATDSQITQYAMVGVGALILLKALK